MSRASAGSVAAGRRSTAGLHTAAGAHPAAPGRSRPIAPARPRRLSGPLREPVTAGAGAVAAPAPGLTVPGGDGRPHGWLEALRALPDHRLVDRLLRGRAWICLIAVALGGIVAMQVSLLKLNAGISQAVERSGTLERQNAELEAFTAKAASGERIRTEALAAGIVMPPAGDVEYLTADPARDAARAAATVRPPSEAARAVMANGGRAPAVASSAPATTFAPTASTTPAPAPSAPSTTPAAAPSAPTTTPAPSTAVPSAPPAAAVTAPTTPGG